MELSAACLAFPRRDIDRGAIFRPADSSTGWETVGP